MAHRQPLWGGSSIDACISSLLTIVFSVFLLPAIVSASVTHEDGSSHTLSCSHELNIAYYTKHSNMARPTLLNSAELSRVFKDNIAHKLQTEIRKG